MCYTSPASHEAWLARLAQVGVVPATCAGWLAMGDPLGKGMFMARKTSEERRASNSMAVRKYRAANLVKIRANDVAYSKKYRTVHPEKIRAANKLWRESHQEEIRFYKRSWDATHRDKLHNYTRKWDAANRESKRASSNRYRAKKANATINDFTAAQWVELQVSYDHRCAYCHKRAKGHLTQDHVTPLSKGGLHTLVNIVPACRSCNAKKHTGPPLSPVQPLLLTLASAKENFCG